MLSTCLWMRNASSLDIGVAPSMLSLVSVSAASRTDWSDWVVVVFCEECHFRIWDSEEKVYLPEKWCRYNGGLPCPMHHMPLPCICRRRHWWCYPTERSDDIQGSEDVYMPRSVRCNIFLFSAWVSHLLLQTFEGNVVEGHQLSCSVVVCLPKTWRNFWHSRQQTNGNPPWLYQMSYWIDRQTSSRYCDLALDMWFRPWSMFFCGLGDILSVTVVILINKISQWSEEEDLHQEWHPAYAGPRHNSMIWLQKSLRSSLQWLSTMKPVASAHLATPGLWRLFGIVAKSQNWKLPCMPVALCSLILLEAGAGVSALVLVCHFAQLLG